MTSSDVTIEGMTINGSNDATSGFTHNGGVNLGGVPIDAAEGIVSYAGVGNINVSHNIVRNTAYTGINFDNYVNSAATSGNTISYNLIEGLSQAYGFGVGILLYDNFYAAVTHNVINNARVGVQTGNFYQANPGGAGSASISDNTISANRIGVFL